MTDTIVDELTGDPNDIQIGGDHYKGTEYQHWDWAADNEIPYLEAAASKYLARWDSKGCPELDLKKSQHYIQKIADIHRKKGYQGPPKSDEASFLRYYTACGMTAETGALCLRISTWRTQADLNIILSGIEKMLDTLTAVTIPAGPPTVNQDLKTAVLGSSDEFAEFEV